MALPPLTYQVGVFPSEQEVARVSFPFAFGAPAPKAASD
jgi:hypothetical protein